MFSSLKPAADALADHDRIYAVIRATGVNQDGRTSGITVPNPDAQAALIREVTARSGLHPEQICYVEAHGTGTAVGDPLEMAALGATLGQAEGRTADLVVGSIKNSIGHLEAAAGVASVIKAALTVHHRQIAPQARLTELNPAIPFAEQRLRVATEAQPFPPEYPVAAISVNGFGYGGTNAHAVLVEAPEPARPLERPAPATVLPVSGRNEAGARQLARDLLAFVADTAVDPAELVDSIWSRRAHHNYRLGVVFGDRAVADQGHQGPRIPSGGNCHGLQVDRRRTSPLAGRQCTAPGRPRPRRRRLPQRQTARTPHRHHTRRDRRINRNGGRLKQPHPQVLTISRPRPSSDFGQHRRGSRRSRQTCRRRRRDPGECVRGAGLEERWASSLALPLARSLVGSQFTAFLATSPVQNLGSCGAGRLVRVTGAHRAKGVVLSSATVTVDCAVIQRETPDPDIRHLRTEGPVRTCIGCRRRELAVDLLRVVAVSNGNGQWAVTVDSAVNLPGRGAWLHPDDRCLQASVRRRAFARALRITGSPDITAVVEFLSSARPMKDR